MLAPMVLLLRGFVYCNQLACMHTFMYMSAHNWWWWLVL